MRSRREYLALLTSAGAVGTAGCLEQIPGNGDGSSSQDDSEREPSDRNENTASATVTTGDSGQDAAGQPTVEPTFEWDESIAGNTGDQYFIQLTADFGSAERIRVETGSGRLARALTPFQEGEPVPVTGLATPYGPAEEGTLLRATWIDEDGIEHPGSTFRVGSRVQPAASPDHLEGIIGGTGEDLHTGGFTEREYDYRVFGSGWTYTAQVPENLVEHYRSRTRIEDFGTYVSDPLDDDYIQQIANTFTEEADSDREAIEHARAFVQHIDYTTDRVSQGVGEYPQFPVETMFGSEGDCEDACILLSSIFRAMGYGTVLLAMWDENHMALGIAGEESIPGSYYEYQGTRYYFVEATAPGWQIGQVPDGLQGAEAEIIEVNDDATLTFSWNLAAEPGGVDVAMHSTNWGPETATNVRGVAAFEDRAGSIVAEGSGRFGTMEPNDIATTSIQLDVPADRELRGRFQIHRDGILFDEATTDWIAPQ